MRTVIAASAAVCATGVLTGCSRGVHPSLDARPEISMEFRYVESADPKSPNCLSDRSENPDADERAIVTDTTHCVLVGPAEWTVHRIVDADIDLRASKPDRIVIKLRPASQRDIDGIDKIAADADGRQIAILFQGRLYGPVAPDELTRDGEVRITTDLAEPIARYLIRLMSGSRV